MLTVLGAAQSAWLPLPALAADEAGGTFTSQLKTFGEESELESAETSPAVIAGRIIKGFMGLLGMVLVALVLYAGFLWMTAGGNADQVAKAKKIITNAVIGLIILLAAYAITDFVVSRILMGTGAAPAGGGQQQP